MKHIYTFKNQQLYTEAITHKSTKKAYNNERLEFLGDAVLDLIVAEFLLNKFPNAHEGELTKIRASLVNEGSFAKLSKAIGLSDCVVLSASEEKNHGREKPSILSDAFEAYIGAIYLDGGLEVTMKIVATILEENYPNFDLKSVFKDYKTSLQELTQLHLGALPTYKVVAQEGPDHDKTFTIALFVNGKFYANGIGKNKKEAEQEAAKETIQLLNKGQL